MGLVLPSLATFFSGLLIGAAPEAGCYHARPMRRTDFHFELPPELIAQQPLAARTASRLLYLDGTSGTLADRQFADLPDLLAPGDLLVFNDTRVIPARLYGHKPSGGKVEVLVERVLDAHRALAQVRASKTPKLDGVLVLDGGIEARVLARHDDLFELAFSGAPLLELLEQHGHIPLPPYVARPDTEADRARYQTVYARAPGAVAAPTAGLHFDNAILDALAARGVEKSFVTLHVGAGTFQPVRAENIEDHKIHAEYLVVNTETCAAVQQAHARGNRVIAVGTTAVRALESAAANGELTPYQGDTRLFIYPGYRFRCVDAMLTNFHLPESSLLMLVAAFAGHANIMAAYRHAIQARYRFFSYGDAMLLTPQKDARA